MTTATEPPVFSSPELQKAVHDARSALEGVDSARNRLSADIKALEAYLVGLGLKTSFRYSLGKHLEAENEELVGSQLEYGGSASGHIVEEFLALDVDSAGNQRLLYEVHRSEGYVDVDAPGGPYFADDDTEEIESRPLIETKFEIRKKFYPRLPDFVRTMGQELSMERLFEDKDKIPF
jgi:hypothetical protein